ncbi:MAG: acyl-CoA thioesterase, partial [Caldilineae bacterium]
MPRIYRRHFRVRHYELDGRGCVNHAVYLNYFQQAAIEASTDAGYGPERYRAMGVVWLVRKTTLAYEHPAAYGDTLLAETWVSEFRRVQSHREYRLTKTGNGQTVACARMNWAFLDRRTMTPARIPPEMTALFAPNG